MSLLFACLFVFCLAFLACLLLCFVVCAFGLTSFIVVVAVFLPGPNEEFWEALMTICTEEVKKLEQEEKGGSSGAHGSIAGVSCPLFVAVAFLVALVM